MIAAQVGGLVPTSKSAVFTKGDIHHFSMTTCTFVPNVYAFYSGVVECYI